MQDRISQAYLVTKSNLATLSHRGVCYGKVNCLLSSMFHIWPVCPWWTLSRKSLIMLTLRWYVALLNCQYPLEFRIVVGWKNAAAYRLLYRRIHSMISDFKKHSTFNLIFNLRQSKSNLQQIKMYQLLSSPHWRIYCGSRP